MRGSVPDLIPDPGQSCRRRLRNAPYLDLAQPADLVARPRLDDDGQSVTLDLHGARVEEALRLSEALVIAAARHGRSTIRLIHGSSTTGLGGGRTIKSALYRALDDGDFDRHATSSFKNEGALLLGLAPSPSPLRRRLRLDDLT